MNLPLLNREFRKPADDWYHVIPLGEFPNPESGFLQVIDPAAISKIVQNFHASAQTPNFPGVLIDFDHFSYEPDKPSEAAGWITDLEARADGAWAKVRWSDLGDAAILNGRYRMISPAWMPSDVEQLGEKKVRPIRLDTAGLTNAPNLRGMVPLSNRATAPEAPPAASTAAKLKPHMNRLNAALGLSADASEDSALAEVNKIITQFGESEKTRIAITTERDAIKNRLATLEVENATLVADQIDSDLDAHGIKDATVRGELKPTLVAMKNREARQRFLATCFKPAASGGKPKPVLNRNQGANPELPLDPPDAQASAAARETKIQEIRMANRCTYAEANNLARMKHPELYGLQPASN